MFKVKFTKIKARACTQKNSEEIKVVYRRKIPISNIESNK